jgi:glycosyltransferase involved in cell wall biosynthesis
MAAFAAKVPMPWRLVLLQRRRAGKGLRSLASDLGIAHRMVWLDAIPRQDVVTLLQAAGALIHPSVYEGFGLPILEAMACGCPVVASDIPPFREITARATLLFPPDNLPALATALSDIVRSPERRRSMSEHGLARARDFSWDRAARETLEVYHDATSAGHR